MISAGSGLIAIGALGAALWHTWRVEWHRQNSAGPPPSGEQAS